MSGWPVVPLGSIVKRVKDEINICDDETYARLTIRLNGKGIVKRDQIKGLDIGTKKQFIARSGQLVLSKIDARNGAFGVLPDVCNNAIITGNFWAFDVDQARLIPKYFDYLTKTRTFIEFCLVASEGTTNRRYLQEDRFLSQQIALPPLSEQRRVVARIEELSAQIHEARALRHQTTREAEALISARISKMFETRDCWGTVNDAIAKHRGAVRSGPFGSQLLHEEFTDAGVTAIGTRDVQTNRFHIQSGWFVSHEKFQQVQRYQVFSNDVLCTIIGGSIGRFCVVPQDVPLAFTTKHIQALTLDSTIADAHFMSWMLNYHRRCRASLFSQVEGSAQPSLNAGKILATLFPLPPMSEQRRIVAELDALQAEVDALKRLQAETSAELDALLPAILDRAFKGEL